MKISFENTTLEFDDELVKEFEDVTCDNFLEYAPFHLPRLREHYHEPDIHGAVCRLVDLMKEEIAIAKGEL